VIVGGCRDFSQIIDFLAAYLFPNGERVIDEYIPTGVSMGGKWHLPRYVSTILTGLNNQAT